MFGANYDGDRVVFWSRVSADKTWKDLEGPRSNPKQGVYHKFMDDYLTLGHMKPTSVPEKYFILHHAVVKHEEKGLKIRVVFDASTKSTSGRSLNDCLCTGPKLQTEISDVLLRSRFNRYVFVADIAKMYRKIRVREVDCVYQHILWRRSPGE